MYRQLRRGRTVPVFVLLILVAGVFGLASPGRAGAVGDKPTLTKDVDANGDAVFSDTENVPKTVSYPWAVTFRLTYTGGSFNHKIVALTDSTTSDLGDCA